MTDWMDLTNYAVVSASLIIAILGLIVNLSLTYMDRWSKHFFTILFSILTAYIASDFFSQISLSILGDRFALLSKAMIFSESLFSSLLMPLLTVYLLHLAEEPPKKAPYMYIVLALWICYFTLLIITQFTAFIYYVTPDNVYHRGAMYPMLLIPSVLLMLTNIVLLWQKKRKLTKKEVKALSVYLIIPLFCMLIQMAVYGLLMIVIGTSVASLFLFVSILKEQMELYISQKEEVSRHRAANMALQMRPHFIYNTMMSIYYLIKQDSNKAQQLTLDFTNYLRKNFTAITKESTIPFTEELDHTKAYLSIEQVRFEGILFTSFDTPHTMFRLPPLTLQPIVENAVKHGVSRELPPCTITVTTRQTETGSLIIIEDTGPGFDAGDNDGPHIALNNIRERLKLSCNGTLSIKPREGGGTVVTVEV